MKFTKKIGDILFSGYYKGGKDGNPKIRQGTAGPVSFEEANRKGFPFFLGKIRTDVVMVDYDDPEAFEARLRISKAKQEHCIVIRSENRGGHFYWFNRQKKVTGSTTHNKTALTLDPVDYKCGFRTVKSTGETKEADTYGALSMKDRTFREVVYCNPTAAGELDEVPFYDLPVRAWGKDTGVSFLDMEEGSRQESFFQYMIPLKKAGYTYEEYLTVADLAQRYLLKTPLEDNQYTAATRKEAWDSVKCGSEMFGEGGSFRHNEFALYLMEKYHIKKINGQLHIYQDGVYIPGTDAIESAMIDEIPSLRKRQRNEVLDFLQIRSSTVSGTDLSRIAFTNGVYNLDTDQLEQFTPGHIVTNKIPWEYRSDAVSPVIDRLLDNLSCGDQQIRYLLEEVAGACLYRSNKLGGGKMVLLYGDKDNGKSTYIELIQSMLGERNYSELDLKDFGTRFLNAELYGVLANLGDDISGRYIQDTSLMKKVSTGNEILVEHKGEKPFSFEPYCTPVFSCNVIPKMDDQTGAALKRLLIVPMKGKFVPGSAGYDPEIKYKLRTKENVEYFIQCALDGLSEVRKNGHYTVSEKVEQERTSYEVSNNPVLAFLEDCKDENGNYVGILNDSTESAFTRYKVFCMDNNFRALSKTSFVQQVNRLLDTESRARRINNKLIRCFVPVLHKEV